jgi:hypothetical protein
MQSHFLIVCLCLQHLVAVITAQQQQLNAPYVPRVHFKSQALLAVRYWRGINSIAAFKELCLFIKHLFDTTLRAESTTQVLSKSKSSSYSVVGSECFLRTHGYFVSAVQAQARDDKSSDAHWCIDVGIVCEWPSYSTLYDYMHTTAVKPDQFDVLRWMRQLAYATKLYEDVKPIRTATATTPYNSICSHNIVLCQRGVQLILHEDVSDADNSAAAQQTAVTPLSSQLDAKLNLCLSDVSALSCCSCAENKGTVSAVQALSAIFYELAVATAATTSLQYSVNSNTAHLQHLLRTVPIHSNYRLGDCIRRILSLTATPNKTHTASKTVSIADVCSILDEYAIKLQLEQHIAQEIQLQLQQQQQQQQQSQLAQQNTNDLNTNSEIANSEAEKHRAIIAGLKRAHARVVAYNVKLAYDRLTPEQKLHIARVKHAQKQSLLNAKYRRKCISAASLRHWTCEQIGIWLHGLLSKLTVNSNNRTTTVNRTCDTNGNLNTTIQDENTIDTVQDSMSFKQNTDNTMTRSDSSDSTVHNKHSLTRTNSSVVAVENTQLNSATALRTSKLHHSIHKATTSGATSCDSNNNSYSVHAQRLCTDMQVSIHLLLTLLC